MRFRRSCGCRRRSCVGRRPAEACQLLRRIKTKQGAEGALGYPGQGDHDQGKKKTPQRTRILVLGAPAGAAAHHFLETGFVVFWPV